MGLLYGKIAAIGRHYYATGVISVLRACALHRSPDKTMRSDITENGNEHRKMRGKNGCSVVLVAESVPPYGRPNVSQT